MYYWASLHHWGEDENVEVQEKENLKFWGRVNRLLLNGWEVVDMKIMNRREN